MTWTRSVGSPRSSRARRGRSPPARAGGRRAPCPASDAREERTSRPERGAYFVRWVTPDGTRKPLLGGRTIADANAVLAAVFDDERREAGGQPAERLLHEFLADEHLPALMARLAPKVFLTRKSRLLAVAKLLGTKPMCEVRRVGALLDITTE